MRSWSAWLKNEKATQTDDQELAHIEQHGFCDKTIVYNNNVFGAHGCTHHVILCTLIPFPETTTTTTYWFRIGERSCHEVRAYMPDACFNIIAQVEIDSMEGNVLDTRLWLATL